MAKELGISEAKSKTYLRVYEYMIEKNDLVPEHWSYYEELLKNRNITKASEKDVKLKNKIVEKPKIVASWIDVEIFSVRENLIEDRICPECGGEL